MNETTADLRVKRTLYMIKNAYLTLLSQKSFDDVSIKDICDLAIVHRTTFYKHYKDKFDLANSIIRDLENDFIVNAKHKKEFANEKEFYLFMLENILDFVNQNKTMFKNVLELNKETVISFMITQAIERNAMSLLKNSASKILTQIPLELTARFMASGITAIGIWWLMNDTNYTKKDILKYIDYIITKTMD